MITLNDLKIIQEVVPTLESQFVSGAWNREQGQKACSMVYNRLTSDEGKKIILTLHDGMEEKHGIQNY